MSVSKPSDPLCGLKSFSIAGRMVERRQRCLGMTDEERRWRAQWLKDQVLSEEEPRFCPEHYKDTNNFIRRLWKTPYEALEKSLQPSLGVIGAAFIRQLLGRGMVLLGFAYVGCYYIKYHANDFTTFRTVEVGRSRGPMHPSDPNYPNYEDFTTFRTVEVGRSRGPMHPSDPNYPNYEVKKPSDYYDQGFYSSVLAKKV